MALGSARRRVCLRPLKPHTGARPRTAIIVWGHSVGWLTLLAAQARGGLVDKMALAAAAREGRIGGAALDVFDREPPDFDDAIFSCDNIVTTPHVAAMTRNAQIAMAEGAATEIRRVLVEGLPPTNNVLL
jgi:phosphoglycerate dehydrogenase-like enzyme